MTDQLPPALNGSYREIPYFSQPYPQSHPDRLATIGKLFGLLPARIDQSRVLELGCAGGGNLIPMAYYLPSSSFLGAELDEAQAGEAQKSIKDLELKNIRIEQCDISNIDRSWGIFDFIICHGVFSWVPSPVQEKVFSILAENLSENGIGYISYNTYPGWHMAEIIRNMMLYHAGQFNTPEECLSQGKAFIDFIAGALDNSFDPYALFIKNELRNLAASEDWYIFHDYMEAVNTPIYFHQFINRADSFGLQYLGESCFNSMFDTDISAESSKTIDRISGDIIQNEQYLDFLRNRKFRQTLLCRKDIELRRELDSDSLDDLLIASNLVAENDSIDFSPGSEELFNTFEGSVIRTNNPHLKAGLCILKEHWPKAIKFNELVDLCMPTIRKKLGYKESRNFVKKELGREMLHCYVSEGIEIYSWQGSFFPKVSSKPKINNLALYQLRQRQWIANQFNQIVEVDDFTKYLIPLLNGQNDKADMLAHMQNLVVDGTVTIRQFDIPVTNPDKIQKLAEKKLDTFLNMLMEATLLVG